MRIGILIPTRGDRPELLSFALNQMERQTRRPDTIEIVNDSPLSQDKDITWRYRLGCERLLKNGADVILLIEDDDFYSEDYLDTMVTAWEKNGNSQIFGIGETTYYHLGLRSFYQQRHPERASAFCTMLTANGINKMKWPKDNYSFTDIEFWKNIPGKTFMPSKLIALGIKGHNSGSLFGGIGHNSQWGGYKQTDLEMTWLKNIVDNKAFEFYKNISDRIK
jgi:hypothetical protein